MVAFRNRINMGLNTTAEEPAVILTSLYHHRKIGKLSRTVVNVQTVQVILDNACHCFTSGETVCFVNLHQHIKHICQDVTGTAARVNALDLLRCDSRIFLANLVKPSLYIRFLFRFVQIVFPLGFQFIIRMSLNPKTTERVFYHVANDPVRGKQLRSGRNVLLGDFHILLESNENLILFLTVVILVQPAYNLNSVFPIVLVDAGNHLLNDAAFTEQVVRQKKLRIVGDLLEHSWQNLVQSIALHDQEVLIQFFCLVCFFVSIDLLHIQTIQVQVNGFGQNLRLEVVIFIRKHTHMGRQVVVHFHETQGRETVEPSVGDLLHNLLISFFFNLFNQSSPLLLFSGRKQMTTHAIIIWISDLFIGNTIFQRPLAHTED